MPNRLNPIMAYEEEFGQMLEYLTLPGYVVKLSEVTAKQLRSTSFVMIPIWGHQYDFHQGQPICHLLLSVTNRLIIYL